MRDGRARAKASASPASTPAPTTTSPSRSARASWPPGCARRCAAAAAPRRRRSARRLSRHAPAGRLRRGVGGSGRRAGEADATRVRTAPLPGREPQPRAVARSPARTGVGLRPADRDAVGRRARRAGCAPSSAPPASRSRPWSASATASSNRPARRQGRASVQPSLRRLVISTTNARRARSTRCQSVYTRLADHTAVLALEHPPAVGVGQDLVAADVGVFLQGLGEGRHRQRVTARSRSCPRSGHDRCKFRETSRGNGRNPLRH